MKLLLLIFCFFVFAIPNSVFAEVNQSTEEIVKSIVEKYKKADGNLFEGNNTAENKKIVQDAIANAEKRSKKATDLKDIFAQNAVMAKTLGNQAVADQLNNYVENFSAYNKKVPTIFYFYSESMSAVALERFYSATKKLQAHFPKENISAYAVFRGFPSDLKNFASSYKKESVSGGKFKFHPMMYKFYGLISVPAFAFAYCPQDFSFNQCEKHLLVKGDISLSEALKIFSEENKQIAPYYNYLTTIK